MTPAPHPRKILGPLFAASLAVNLGLLAAIVIMSRPPPTPGQPDVQKKDSRAEPPRQEGLWSSFQGDDPAALMIQLRAAGFPPDIVREMMMAFFQERDAGRSKPEQKEAAARLVALGVEPAASGIAYFVDENKPREQGFTLQSSAAENEQRILLRREYGELPPEKMAQLERILADQNELTRKLLASGGNLLGSDEYRLLQKETTADIARLLTPAEYFEYQLRSSGTAHGLRQRLENFRPSEAEFRMLFPLFREWEAQSSPPGSSPRKRAAPPVIPASLEAQIEQVLGPVRFAEYQQATEPSARPATTLMR